MWCLFVHKENVKGLTAYENHSEFRNITSPADNVSKHFSPQKF
jgi:hypothetical protein